MNEPPKRSPITTGGYIPWLVRAKYNAMGKRAMTEDIRKKHIVQKDYIERKQGNEPYLCQSIHSVISVADVDALLAALDAERRKVEKALEYASNHLIDGPARLRLKEILTGEG